MALTSDTGSNFEVKFGKIQTYKSGAQIYRGALCAVRLTDGKVYPAVSDIPDTFKQLVVGFSMESVTAADMDIRIRREGKIRLRIAGNPSGAAGKLACILDDESVQLWSASGTCTVVVGRITERPSSTTAFVDLEDRPYRLASGAND
jgi:hypothetical protein